MVILVFLACPIFMYIPYMNIFIVNIFVKKIIIYSIVITYAIRLSPLADWLVSL